MPITKSFNIKPTGKEKGYISDKVIAPFGLPTDLTIVLEKCRNANSSTDKSKLQRYKEKGINEDWYYKAKVDTKIE